MKEMFWTGSTTNRAEALKVADILKRYFKARAELGNNKVGFSVRTRPFYTRGETEIVIETNLKTYDLGEVPQALWESEVKPVYGIINTIIEYRHIR